MINKLRKKIILIIQISLSIILLGVIIIFSGLSYNNTITSSTMFMERMDRNGKPKDSQQEEPEGDRFNKDPFLINIDGVYRLEVKNGEITRETSGVTEEIRNYAIKESEKNTEEGYIDKYIYKIRKVGNNTKEITLIENETAIKRLKATLIIAFSVAILGLIIIYVIAKKLSKIKSFTLM